MSFADAMLAGPRPERVREVADLVAAAHGSELRVILDVVFNHTGNNWVYAGDQDQPPYRPWPQHYERGWWRDGQGGLTDAIAGADDAVWPRELQSDDYYT